MSSLYFKKKLKDLPQSEFSFPKLKPSRWAGTERSTKTFPHKPWWILLFPSDITGENLEKITNKNLHIKKETGWLRGGERERDPGRALSYWFLFLILPQKVAICWVKHKVQQWQVHSTLPPAPETRSNTRALFLISCYSLWDQKSLLTISGPHTCIPTTGMQLLLIL